LAAESLAGIFAAAPLAEALPVVVFVVLPVAGALPAGAFALVPLVAESMAGIFATSPLAAASPVVVFVGLPLAVAALPAGPFPRVPLAGALAAGPLAALLAEPFPRPVPWPRLPLLTTPPRPAAAAGDSALAGFPLAAALIVGRVFGASSSLEPAEAAAVSLSPPSVAEVEASPPPTGVAASSAAGPLPWEPSPAGAASESTPSSRPSSPSSVPSSPPPCPREFSANWSGPKPGACVLGESTTVRSPTIAVVAIAAGRLAGREAAHVAAGAAKISPSPPSLPSSSSSVRSATARCMERELAAVRKALRASTALAGDGPCDASGMRPAAIATKFMRRRVLEMASCTTCCVKEATCAPMCPTMCSTLPLCARAAAAIAWRCSNRTASCSHCRTARSGNSAAACEATADSSARFQGAAQKATHSHTRGSAGRRTSQRKGPALGPSSAPKRRASSASSARASPSSPATPAAGRSILKALATRTRLAVAFRFACGFCAGSSLARSCTSLRTLVSMRFSFQDLLRSSSSPAPRRSVSMRSRTAALMRSAPVRRSRSIMCARSEGSSGGMAPWARARRMAASARGSSTDCSIAISAPSPTSCSDSALLPPAPALCSRFTVPHTHSTSCRSASLRIVLSTYLVSFRYALSSSSSLRTASDLLRRGGNMTITAARMAATFWL